MAVADYVRPVPTAVTSTFLTARAAARAMVPRGAGVTMMFGGMGPPSADWPVGGLQTALQAMEAMRRQLSAELGRYGIRVVTLRTGGVSESVPADVGSREKIAASIAGSTLLGRAATLADVGHAAAFAASDHARTMTAATLNLSARALIDY